MRRHLYKVNVACVALAGWLAFDLAMAEANGPVNGVGGELTSRGVVRARAEAVIATDLNARIVALPFRKGDRFKKGDTLVEFDCRRYKEELEAARAENRAELINYNMNVKLERQQAAGRSEVLVAKAKVERTAAQARGLSVRVDQCLITAPYAGRVVDRSIQEHEMPQSNAPLIKIVDDSRLEIDLMIPSKWLGWLTIGTRFAFKVDETDQVLEGEVIRTGAVVDPVSQTADITGVLTIRPDNVLPGMSGTATLRKPGA